MDPKNLRNLFESGNVDSKISLHLNFNIKMQVLGKMGMMMLFTGKTLVELYWNTLDITIMAAATC